MSKIICDVCGTKYPDSAEQCPICGCIRGAGNKLPAQMPEDEQIQLPERPHVRGGRFSKSNVRKRNRDLPTYEVEKPIIRDNPREQIEEEYEEFEPQEKSNVVVNILLVIVILALLAVSGYIFTKYLLPNVMQPEQTVPTTAQTQPTPTETEEPTTEPRIPCTGLILDEAVALLERQGQQWLINVAVLPETTTDELQYTSSDENVVTVDADGVVTAVGEGNATITIVCGQQQTYCTVAVILSEEPQPTDAPAAEETKAPSTEETAAPTTEETKAPEQENTQLKDVKLTLKQSDVTFRANGQQATFKLTCGLKASEVQWSSENDKICTVDENGVVTRTGKGTTNVVVKYGTQEVKIIVRCP